MAIRLTGAVRPACLSAQGAFQVWGFNVALAIPLEALPPTRNAPLCTTPFDISGHFWHPNK